MYRFHHSSSVIIIRHQDTKGKILIIGGGIANFTDVAATFTGIQKAMKQFRDELLEAKVSVCVCYCVLLCIVGVNLLTYSHDP